MKTFLLFIFSGIYFISSAQTSSKPNYTGYLGTLSGKVTDSSTGKPLPGASIYIADLKLGVVANESGNHRFANLPSGTYLERTAAVNVPTLGDETDERHEEQLRCAKIGLKPEPTLRYHTSLG